MRSKRPKRVRPNPRVKAPTNSRRDVSKHYAPETEDPRDTTSYWEHPPEEPTWEEEWESRLQGAAIAMWWDGATYEEIGRALYDTDGEEAAKAKSIIQTAAKHFGVDVEHLREAILDSHLRQIAAEFRARGMNPQAMLYDALQTGRRPG